MAKTPVKVYVWKCLVHGETELFEDLTEAYCTKCGKAMERTGSYDE